MVTNSISESSNNQALVYSNSIEVLNKLFNSLTSKELSATITLKNASGEDVVMTLPNLFFLDSEIKRLDNNVNSLSGVNNVVYLQNSDGTYNKVFSDKLTSTPSPVNNLRLPVEFNRKNNWFFENFLTPLLYIDFDLTDLVDSNVTKLSVTRVILNTDNDISTNYFNSQLKGRTDLDYDTLMLNLGQQGISFYIDNDTYNFNPSILRYNGSFGILPPPETFESFNDSLGRMVRYYKFTNINYTDNLSTSKNTQTLKVGDVLSVSKATKYKVETIDVASGVLSLTLVSGVEPIPTGDNVLTLDSQTYSNKKISVNVGYDEKQIIFVTPINDLNVTTPFLSNGVCFDSNELRLVNSNNEVVTLEEYYRKEVVDFGQQIMNLAKEKSIPTIFGEIPNAPNLPTTWIPTQINTHIEKENITENIKKLLADKTQTKNEISAKDVAIADLVLKIQKTTVVSERTPLENNLNTLTGVRNGLITKYNSIITSLSLIYKENSIDNIKPKYRIRGMFGYPNKVFNERTGYQEIVNFKVSYRYLTISGNTPNQKEYTYTAPDGRQFTGVFSNWNVYYTEPRKRIFKDDKYVWEDENNQDNDSVKTNQVDIPISVGEAVEIKIQSVSEAGYPTNPLISDFSNSVIVPFPESLNNQLDLYSLLEEASREQERVLIYQQIANYDFARHFLNNRNVDNVYYGHDTTEVSHYDGSGYVRVSDVIKKLQDQITSLTNELNKVGGNNTTVDFRTGKLKVYIKGVDRDGDIKIYPVYGGDTVELTPPSYIDRISKLSKTDILGAIIREKYTLVIENEGYGDLYLSTPYPGLISQNLPYKSNGNWLTTQGNTFIDDGTYTKYRRYDIVPVNYSGFLAPNLNNSAKFGWGKQQAPQTPGQFIYSRYTSVDGFNDLYYPDKSIASVTGVYPDYLRPLDLPTPINYIPPGNNKFLWNGNYDGNKALGGGAINEFCVHINHPKVKDAVRRDKMYNDLYDTENILEHSYGFNVEGGGNVNYRKQSPLISINAKRNKYVKFGFLDTDRYLIGSNTTGLYFYPSPKTPDDIRVGNDYNSTRKLESGKKIEIPLNVEYRMADYFVKSHYSSLLLPQSDKVEVGVVGGYNKNNYNRKNLNISYEKILGFDIFVKDGANLTPFSFDVKVNTIYGGEENFIITK
jgi:hypothetical protein